MKNKELYKKVISKLPNPKNKSSSSLGFGIWDYSKGMLCIFTFKKITSPFTFKQKWKFSHFSYFK